MPARRSPPPPPTTTAKLSRRSRLMRTGRTPKKDVAAEAQRSFLEGLGHGLSISGAAKVAGVARSTVYEWRAADEAFAKAWDDALEEGSDILEDEALRRAVHGVSRQVAIGSGPRQKIVDLVEYSDVLLIFLLKARRPERFRENVHVRTEGVVTVAMIAQAREKLAKMLGVNER